MQRLVVILVLLLVPRVVIGATLLHCGQFIDVHAGKILTNVTVTVDGNNITGVTPGLINAGAQDQVVDLRTQTCMPGLIDMHVHLTSQYSERSAIERFTANPADYAYRSVGYAERTLLAGFTTVRDLGGVVNIALRNAIASGAIKGPRLYTSGRSLATTGGHADPTNGMRNDLVNAVTPEDGVINSVEEGRAAVRQRYKDGADLIKITATGGVLSVAASSHNPQFTEQEIRGIVETANDYGFKVAAHAHGAEGIKRAVRAGVASIEHGTFLDDEGISLMKTHGTYYVPTVMAGKWVSEKALIDGFFPAVVRRKALEIGPLSQETFAKAYRAGVKIAFGTDTGVSAHGENAREFEYLVQAGMPALAAIRAATLDAATLLGEETRLGTIEKGKWADIIAVEQSPVQDISSMRRVSFVMKAGTIYKQPK